MKKLVFDFDGTLVDSMPTFSRSMVAVLDKNGIKYPENIIEIVTPLGAAGTARYYIDTLGMEKTVEEILELLYYELIDGYTNRIEAKETVAETLAVLRARGYSLNVLTASPHTMLDVCLKRVGLYDIFDNVWSCDDFGTTKSDEGIYHAVAARLGTTVEDCIFFDDNINADRTAKSAGMTVVGVYDDSSRDQESAIRALTDMYIYKFSELCDLLD